MTEEIKMFTSYVKIALRSLLKNKLYAVINILGLAIGLTVYLMAGYIHDYENNHDHMFANRDKTFTLYTVNNPERNAGAIENRGTYLMMKGLLDTSDNNLITARSIKLNALVRSEDKKFYDNVHFVDAEFTNIFNFTVLSGDMSSFSGPNQAIITKSMAEKYFGRINVAGEQLSLSGSDASVDVMIVAVIDDVPLDSHFNSSLTDQESLSLLVRAETLTTFYKRLNYNNNWGWLSSDFITYVMTDGRLSADRLSEIVTGIFDKNAPKDEKEMISAVVARPLKAANLHSWYSLGVPVIDILEYLGLMVLAIVVINYANLATAQNMGRLREVGLRKTLGATRRQLLAQFIIESQSIVFIAMMVALVILEMLVPLFNSSLNKVLVVDYTQTIPTLVLTTLIVGLIAGLYPAYVITRAQPAEAIKSMMLKGKSGSLFRSGMIGVQFVITIVLLGVVMVVFMQNRSVVRESEVFPKERIITLSRLENPTVLSRKESLLKEISNLPDVKSAAYSTQIPYMNQNWTWRVTKEKGDKNSEIPINNMMVSPEFFDTYEIPMLAGRSFSHDYALDKMGAQKGQANVVINRLAMEQLGFDTPEAALGQSFYAGNSQLVIIGVMENRNIHGLQHHQKPFAITWSEQYYRFLSVRLKAGSRADILKDIEGIWQKINPDFPIEWSFLDRYFDEQFKLMRVMNGLFAGFSALALMLALFGLFGLAAFMAQQRTREIGIRKVLGASIRNIVPMLLVQFSKPALWAMALAIPLAYVAAGYYLEVFANQINFTLVLILIAGLTSILLSWATVAVHALKVASENPIKALRYE